MIDLNNEKDKKYLLNHPLINVDYDLVRERAYLRYLKKKKPYDNMTLDNWLSAEKDELMLELRSQPLVNIRLGKSCLDFNEHYEPLSKFSYIYDSPAELDFIGTSECICAFCGENDTNKFRSIAHVIPESFGNKWLATRNECDECNKKYGRLYENQLGNMFMAERAFGRIHNKKKTSRARFSDNHQSFIGGQSRNEALSVNMFEGDNSVKFNLISEHRAKVSILTPRYKPLSAIKSLAKATWLGLPVIKRSCYTDVLDWIIDPDFHIESNLHIAFIPGPGLSRVGMTIWERKSANESLPRLVSLIHTSNFALIFTLPDMLLRKACTETVLPSIPLSVYPPHLPKITSITKSSNASESKGEVSMEYCFESLSNSK